MKTFNSILSATTTAALSAFIPGSLVESSAGDLPQAAGHAHGNAAIQVVLARHEGKRYSVSNVAMDGLEIAAAGDAHGLDVSDVMVVDLDYSPASGTIVFAPSRTLRARSPAGTEDWHWTVHYVVA